MTRARIRLWLSFAIVLYLFAGGRAFAEVRLETSLSTDRVEVGQQFRLRLEARSSEERVEGPQLEVPNSFVVNGPSVGTQQSISIVNGRVERSIGTTATWVLRPTQVGSFELGPGSFNVGGKLVQGERVKIEVLAEGTLPSPPRRRSRSPFDDDLFPNFRQGSIFDEIFGDRGVPSRPTAPPEYQTAHAPDPTAFLRATITPTRAVVGQQVTLRVYAYGALGMFGEGQSQEPRHPDFFAHPILGNSVKQQHYDVSIGQRQYTTLKLRELALFPLKAGRLEVGPMRMNFYGRNYTSARHPEGIERSSNPVFIEVTDPPSENRPAGYQLGDVGDFRLDAEIEPRETEAGGAVSVVATLQGVGRLPARLVTPERKGVEWLEPALHDQERIDASGQLAGSRTFTYIVRIDEAGEIDLGDLTLPYYSAALGRYRVARADLGTVHVSASAKPARASTEPELRLSEQFEPRTEFRVSARGRSYLADQPWFFPSLVTAPALFLVGRGVLGIFVSARRRRSASKSSPLELSNEALRSATAELRRGDARTALACIERGVFLAIEGATGVRARALLLHELSSRLVEAGLSDALASDLVDLLSRAERARFGGEAKETDELLRATKGVKKSLDKHARQRKVR